MGEIARRARLSKQTMTTMVRLLERDGIIERRDAKLGERRTAVIRAGLRELMSLE